MGGRPFVVCLFFYKKLAIYFVVSATLRIFAAKIKAMINKQLLQPESIVIIGGSNNYHKPGGAIVRNILNGGYKGTLERYASSTRRRTRYRA